MERRLVIVSCVVIALGLGTVGLLAARATSESGVPIAAVGWSVSGPRSMVLSHGPLGSPDAWWAFQPSVVRAPNGTYLMYYTGYDGSRDRILAATSPDGTTWTKLPWSLFVDNGAAGPFVLVVGGEYRMWFESITWGSGPLGYADRIVETNSSDGVTWSAPWVVVDVGNGSAADAGGVSGPTVAPDPQGGYRMYYTATAANGTAGIAVATSTDGVNFTKRAGGPVLLPGPAGTWDDFIVSDPAVIPGSSWTLFYSGRRSTGYAQMGVATSPDGWNWTADPEPFLSTDAPGSWDSAQVGSPSVLSGSSPWLYFDGSAGGNGTNGIGMVRLVPPSSGSGSGSVTAGTTVSLDSAAALLAFVGAGAGVAVLAAVALTLSRGSWRGL